MLKILRITFQNSSQIRPIKICVTKRRQPRRVKSTMLKTAPKASDNSTLPDSAVKTEIRLSALYSTPKQMKSGVGHFEQTYLIKKWNTILTVIGLDNGAVHY